MTQRAIILKHVAFEGPARIAELLRERGYALDVRELYAGAAVPERLEAGELLIVMGGPMGVADLNAPTFPFLRAERDLLLHCLQHERPMLGVCLGAQLMAAAAGAQVGPMTRPRAGGDGRVYEVGWAPVTFHPDGHRDALLRDLPLIAPMVHWHGDAFELPAEARRLASTSLCPTQAFAIGPKARAIGVQFHCELRIQDIAGLAYADSEFAMKANGRDAESRIAVDTARYFDDYRKHGDTLLRNLITSLTT